MSQDLMVEERLRKQDELIQRLQQELRTTKDLKEHAEEAAGAAKEEVQDVRAELNARSSKTAEMLGLLKICLTGWIATHEQAAQHLAGAQSTLSSAKKDMDTIVNGLEELKMNL